MTPTIHPEDICLCGHLAAFHDHEYHCQDCMCDELEIVAEIVGEEEHDGR